MPQPTAICPREGFRPGNNKHATVAIPKSRFVKLDVANGKEAVATAAAATDTLYGVTQEQIAAVNVAGPNGGWGDIQVDGRGIVESGAAITAGVRVTSDASGRAVPWAPGAGTNHAVGGLAIVAATGAGEFIEVELAKPGTFQQG